MMTFDPRTISTPVCTALQELRSQTETNSKLNQEKKQTILKQQKNQAIELYTYLSVWGMLRLKAEEISLKDNKKEKQNDEKKAKQDVLKKYFKCLQALSQGKTIDEISDDELYTLGYFKKIDADKYLGLTGLGLQIAQEFSFWGNAIYHDITG